MERAEALAISERSRRAAAGAAWKSNLANRSDVLGPGARRAIDQPFLFSFLLGYFVLEYMRPPYIVELRLQLLFLGLIVIAWASQRRRPWSRNLSLQTAFLAVCLLSITFASNYFSVYLGVRTLSGHVIIALAVTWLMARRRSFVVGLWVWIFTMGYQALHAILTGGRGTGGFLGDENDIALGCCVALPFAIQATGAFRGWRRWGSGALALLFTAAIVASSSRGAFVGLLVVVAYGIFVNPKRVRNLALAVTAALVFYATVPGSYRAEVASIFENREHDTGESRTFLWRAAWNMWLDHPVFGVGIENANWNVGRYQPRDGTGRFSSAMYIQRDWTMQALHSLYFSVLSETGAVGSLLFGAIIVGHFTTIRRLRKRVASHPSATVELQRDTALYGTGLSMAMVGYLSAGAFLSCAYYPYPWMLSALAVAWERAASAEISERDRTEPNRPAEAPKGSQP
jgi:hypothetical protein